MGWIDALHGHIVAVDAAPLIYFAEEHPRYLPIVDPFFQGLDQGLFRAVASTIALLEVLVLPLRLNDKRLAQLYRRILLNSRGLTTVAVSADIAERVANLRAQFQIKTPDSLHLATALHTRAGYFLTNDRHLPSFPDLQVLSLDAIAT